MTAQATALNRHPASTASMGSSTGWHEEFLAMLPLIKDHASYQFRHLKGDNRDEAIQEVVCNCCLAYSRLVEQGRAQDATWSSLAKYAVAQVRSGRRVGTSLNIKDITSSYCQNRKPVSVCSLDRWDEKNQEWTEIVVEDRHATPADVAAFRIDFRAFLRTLSQRNRQIALLLARSHGTQWIAKKFKLSAGRVSQLRRELCEAWQQFHGEELGEHLLATMPGGLKDFKLFLKGLKEHSEGNHTLSQEYRKAVDRYLGCLGLTCLILLPFLGPGSLVIWGMTALTM